MTTAVMALHSNPMIAFLFDRSKWWWACLVAAFCCVSVLTATLVVYAATCSFSSIQYVDRSGVSNSQLVVGMSGVNNSDVYVGSMSIVNISTQPATNVEMVGYPHATLNGEVTDIGGLGSATAYWEWGYDAGYGNVAGSQTISVVGNYTAEFVGFNPDKEVHFRFAVDACGSHAYGADDTFQIAETADYWKISSLIPLAFLFGIIFVVIKGLTNAGGGVALVLAILGALIFFLVAMNFVPTILTGIESMWGGG